MGRLSEIIVGVPVWGWLLIWLGASVYLAGLVLMAWRHAVRLVRATRQRDHEAARLHARGLGWAPFWPLLSFLILAFTGLDVALFLIWGKPEQRR